MKTPAIGKRAFFVKRAGRASAIIWAGMLCGTAAHAGTAFTPGKEFSSGHTEAVALGDLDKDGDVDVFLGKFDGPDEVWMNPGDGKQYVDSGQRMGNNFTRGVSLGDFDGDGDLDAFVANYGQPGAVWINNGHGRFQDSGRKLDEGAISWNVDVGDVDADGDLDAVLANHGAAITSGSTTARAFFATPASDSAIRIPGASRPAISTVTAIWTYMTPIGRTNPTRYGSTTARAGLATAVNAWAARAAAADFDRDGDIDVLVANNGGNRLWANDGRGMFADSGLALGTADSKDAVAADMDKDGRVGAVVGNDGPNRIWFNTGAPVAAGGVKSAQVDRAMP